MELYKVDHNIFKSINDKIISKKRLREYIYDLISCIELDDVVKKVIFTSRIEFGALYDFNTCSIQINYDSLIQYALGLKEIYNINVKNEVIINYYLLNSILHELEHAFQNFIIQGNLLEIAKLYEYEINYFSKIAHDDDYMKYYDLITFERKAEVSSCNNVLKLNEIYSDNNRYIMRFYLKSIKATLTTGYKLSKGKILSPIDILCSEVFKIKTPEMYADSLIDRMTYGFQIMEEEYQYMKKYGRREIKKYLDIK